MRIEITGTNIAVTDEMREQINKRFEKIARLVSELATCDVTLSEARNPAIAASQRAEAHLHVKGTTLNAKAQEREMRLAISETADELERQVRKRREKIKGRGRPGAESIRFAETVVDGGEIPEN